ncbi:hypothetical protein [Fulvimarina sp. MAC3]|uniref:hypothetical protein n=1 Tax=Fulvimarina sp. MAC3 TaxID=3148887 RepID=UPI0031FDCE8A
MYQRAIQVALVSVGLVVPVVAQEIAQTGNVATAPVAETSGPTRTGKERLAAKWTDEQRVDNCKVPPEKRGPATRPVACTSDQGNRKTAK